MKPTDSDRAGPMLNPPHLGELIRESMEEVGWNVTETAERLGCERGTERRGGDGDRGARDRALPRREGELKGGRRYRSPPGPGERSMGRAPSVDCGRDAAGSECPLGQ